MDENVQTVLMGIGVVAATLALSALGKRLGIKGPRSQWADLQDRYHLALTHSPMKLSGVIDGVSFTYFGHGEWKKLVMPIERDIGTLAVRPERGLMKLVGDDFKIGDETFDKYWLIRGNSEKRAKEILTRPTRLLIHNTWMDLGQLGEIVIENQQLKWLSVRGETPATLPDLVRKLGEVKRSLEGPAKKKSGHGD